MHDPVARLNAALSGRYRVERQLGEGGMATVYLADDLKHGRKVALKVLKPELAAVVGAERFLAEIRTTASLQHPHILPLHDSGEAEGLLFYVMPRVEGESLRERLDRERQLSVDEAVRIATAVAHALDYAHRHGVIHRDIKPANILVHDGQPVISDFGIALAVSAGGAGRLTETGLSLGTPHYMSPEQATGDGSVGPATDIWALGCVLYEMLVGEPPYTGGTPQAVLGKIITAEAASATEARRSVPPNVDAVIRQALEKVPADRFNSAREFARALSDPGFRHGDASSRSVASRRYGSLRPASIGAVGLAVGALLTVTIMRGPAFGPSPSPSTEALSFRAAINLPDEAPLAIGFDVAGIGYNSPVIAVSLDGAWLTYVANTPSGPMLQLRDMASGEVRPLPGTEGARHAFFSPDGEWIGFLTVDRVNKVARQGGTVYTLAEASVPVLAWWPEPDTIYYTEPETFGLSRVSADGGTSTRLLTGADTRDAGIARLTDLLPGGRSVLGTGFGSVSGDHQDVVLMDLETGETRQVLRAGFGARYVSPGYLLFGRAGSLLAARFDPAGATLPTEAITLAAGVAMESLMGMLHGVSSGNGLLAHAPGGDLSVGRPAWVSRDGSFEFLDVPEQVYGQLDLSPDERRLAIHVGDVRDYVWVWDLERREGRRVDASAAEGSPLWSADGLRLAGAARETPLRMLVHPVERGGAVGGGVEVPSATGVVRSWAPDAGVLAVESILDRVEFVGLDGDPVGASGFDGYFPAFSPDGRWLAYVSDRTGTNEVFIRSFPDGREIGQVSSGGGIEPLWQPSGDFYYRNGDRWYATHVSTEGEPRWAPPRLVFETDFIDTPGMSYDVSADGQRLLVVKSSRPVVQSRIEIVTNWLSLLEDRR